MSDSWSGSMRGPRVKTPFLLLLLLLLLSALTRTVLCQDYDAGEEPGATEEEGDPEEVDNGDEATSESSTDLDATPTTVTTDEVLVETDPGSTTAEYEGSADTTVDPSAVEPTSTSEEGLSPIIILIPVVLVVLIIGIIVCGIFINRRWKQKASNQELGKEDPYLDGSSTEKVPMPMFEEDVPSVLELEMEELDQWMKKDGEAAGDLKHA